MVIRNPPARTAPEWRIPARVQRGGRRGYNGERFDYRIKVPITLNIRTSASPMNATAQQPLGPSPPPPPLGARRRSVRPSVLQLLAGLLSACSSATDPRRLISGGAALRLLALGWRTMVPVSRAQKPVERVGVRPLSPTMPFTPFVSAVAAAATAAALFSFPPLRLDGKEAVTVLASAPLLQGCQSADDTELAESQPLADRGERKFTFSKWPRSADAHFESEEEKEEEDSGGGLNGAHYFSASPPPPPPPP